MDIKRLWRSNFFFFICHSSILSVSVSSSISNPIPKHNSELFLPTPNPSVHSDILSVLNQFTSIHSNSSGSTYRQQNDLHKNIHLYLGSGFPIHNLNHGSPSPTHILCLERYYTYVKLLTIVSLCTSSLLIPFLLLPFSPIARI